MSTHDNPLGIPNKNLSEHQKHLMAKGLPKKSPIAGVKKVVVVASAKGGVGKSTTAVNFALAMAANEPQAKVGLLDADIYGPSIPMMMNLSGVPLLNDKNQMIPLVNYGIKCMSMGFLVDEKSPIVWRGPMVMSAIQRLLREVAWAPLDYLIVDLPPGTGDTQLTLTQNIPINGAIIVTTPQDIALLDTRRGAEMFKTINVPLLGIVQNMSVYICPKCGHEEHVFGEDGAHRVAKEFNIDILGDVPLNKIIRETSDSGQPVVISDPTGPQTAVYQSIARRAADRLRNLEKT